MNGFAAEWIAAFNSLDLERVLSHYSEDIVLVSPVASERLGSTTGEVHGKKALREYFATSVHPGSPLQFSLRCCYVGMASVVLEYDRHDLRRGAEFMEFDEDGRIRRAVAHYTPSEPKDR